MSGLLEKYSQAVRRQYEFHRHLVMQFLPFRAPSMDEYARAEAERRMHLAIGRAVNDAIFDDHVATVTRAINESWLGETLYINLAPFGSPYREDLMEFIGQRIIVRQSDGTWSANYQHRVFQSRPFFSNEYYSRAYDIASRELRSERNRRFSLTPTDQFGAVLYEVVLAGIAVAGATATPLGPRAPAGASRGTAAAGRRFPGHVNQLPADIADDGRMLLGGGTIRDGFAERGVFRITEEAQFAVRAGRGGSFFDQLFRNRAEAVAYARDRASAGEAVIRRDGALPWVWENGTAGNSVDALYIYEIPEGTMVIEGVVARQRAFSGVVYPGGGPQVAVARRPGQVFRLVGSPVPVVLP